MSLLFHFTCSFIKSPIFLYLFFNYLQKSRNILRNILLVPCFHFFLICWLASNLYCGRSCPIPGHIKYTSHFMWFSGTDAAGKGSRGFLLVEKIYTQVTRCHLSINFYIFVHGHIKSGIINRNLMYK